MNDWKKKAKIFGNVGALKKIMDANIKRIPSFYGERIRLLDNFLRENQPPIDIALILCGALNDAHNLAYHLEGNNLIFFRPNASHRRFVEQPFLAGRVHPERTLLMFDSDMVSGAAMRETAEAFEGMRYDRSKMFGYLNTGCEWRDPGNPELMQIDDLLRR